jgi:hypothetical protein
MSTDHEPIIVAFACAAAEWLGLPTPLPQEDASDPALKPTLTPEQEARVCEIYAADISLWESLHQ